MLYSPHFVLRSKFPECLNIFPECVNMFPSACYSRSVLTFPRVELCCTVLIFLCDPNSRSVLTCFPECVNILPGRKNAIQSPFVFAIRRDKKKTLLPNSKIIHHFKTIRGGMREAPLYDACATTTYATQMSDAQLKRQGRWMQC